LVYRNPTKGAIPDHLKVTSTIAQKKKQRTLVLNHDILCCEYQYSMLSGMSLNPKLVEKDQLRILVLGTGAGLLPMFLKSQLTTRIKDLVTVDISVDMVKVTFLFLYPFRLEKNISALLKMPKSSQLLLTPTPL